MLRFYIQEVQISDFVAGAGMHKLSNSTQAKIKVVMDEVLLVTILYTISYSV